MRKLFIGLIALVAVSCSANKADDGYVVAMSRVVSEDEAWADVAEALRLKHSADVVVYESSPSELLDTLRSLKPRYVALVDKPENIGRDYVIDFHHTSRDIDEDIYADFMWGIITGYDAEAAMRMVRNSTEPLLIKDAVATIMELNSAKWFDNYA